MASFISKRIGPVVVGGVGGVGGIGGVGPTGVVLVVQVIATDPSCNAGITAVLVLLITSMDIGVFENWIGKVPFAVAEASKQT